MRLALVLAFACLSCSSESSTDAADAGADSAPPALGDVQEFAELQSSEGIAFSSGTLYASASGAVHRLTSARVFEKWVDVPGALGIAVRADGHLLVCGKDGDAGVIWRIAPDGSKSTFVGSSGALSFKQPNFVAIAPDDSIVFSDSAADRVYRANADGSSPTLITDSIVYPNGVAFAKDGKSVYVASWKTKQVYSLARNADGSYGAPAVAVEGVENIDGLAVGESGDLYLIANGAGVLRVRGGKPEVVAPGTSFRLAANGAFGKDGWLYVTSLFGPTVNRVYAGEAGAPLPSR